MDERPTYLSLFSGIGGLDLAVEAHGFRCVGQVEYEPACASVLERWWSDVPRWGDVHGFTAAAYSASRDAEQSPGRLAECEEASGQRPRDLGGRADLGPNRRGGGEQLCGVRSPHPDLIIGGYPCQPFSHAGKRGGTDDPRHLWPEFARLVGEFRPRWALLENVPGHLSLGAADVLADLAALGYDATWTTVRAADVGAPHRRERWFCLAQDTSSDTRRGIDGERLRAATDRDRGRLSERSQPHVGAQQPSLRAPRWSDSGGLGTDAPDAEGTEREVAWAGHGSTPFTEPERDLVAVADTQDADGWTGDPVEQGEPGERGSGPRRFDWGPYRPAIERWERVMGPAPMPVDDRNRLSPSFVEWMMGFPPGWTAGMTRTQALKALGNAVVPHQGAAALGLLADLMDSGERQPTLGGQRA